MGRAVHIRRRLFTSITGGLECSPPPSAAATTRRAAAAARGAAARTAIAAGALGAGPPLIAAVVLRALGPLAAGLRVAIELIGGAAIHRARRRRPGAAGRRSIRAGTIGCRRRTVA